MKTTSFLFLISFLFSCNTRGLDREPDRNLSKAELLERERKGFKAFETLVSNIKDDDGGLGLDDLELKLFKMAFEILRTENRLTQKGQMMVAKDSDGFVEKITIGTYKLLNQGRDFGPILKGSIPKEIAYYTKLKELKLYENLLSGPIPAELGKLKNLEVLNLSGNRFSGELPIKTFQKLKKLKHLNLKNLPNVTNLEELKTQLESDIPGLQVKI